MGTCSVHKYFIQSRNYLADIAVLFCLNGVVKNQSEEEGTSSEISAYIWKIAAVVVLKLFISLIDVVTKVDVVLRSILINLGYVLKTTVIQRLEQDGVALKQIPCLSKLNVKHHLVLQLQLKIKQL